MMIRLNLGCCGVHLPRSEGKQYESHYGIRAKVKTLNAEHRDVGGNIWVLTATLEAVK